MAEHAISDGEQHRTAVIGSEALPADETTQLRWGAYLIALPGLVFIIHGIGFIYRTDYTASFEWGINELTGLTAFTLPATHPKVASYITHV